MDYGEMAKLGWEIACHLFSKKPGILAIDDCNDDLHLLELYLKKLEVNYDLCESAEEGLGMLRSKKYATVFLDLRLPGKEGWEVVKNIMDEAPDVHIIVTPGHAGDLERMPTATYFGLILKPLSLQSVKRAIG